MKGNICDLISTLGLIGSAVALAGLLIGVAHLVTTLTFGELTDAHLMILRGRWELVALSAATFLIFLILIPVRVRWDWKSRGVYVAFIISLFAEMFGFPLSVYFLSSVFGLTFFERDFMIYMYRFGMPLGSLVTFVGIMLIILGWREVYRAGNRLATGGVYKYLRHPQYLGLLLVTGGWLIHWPTIPTVAMWPVMIILYYRQSRREDKYLAEKFGEEYRKYAEKTPMLFPYKLRR